jgi:diguanylate cyclase (GGDEF)-like protein
VSALESLKVHEGEMSSLIEMNNALQSASSLDEIFELLQLYCERLLSKFSGSLYILNASKNYLEVKMSWNNPNMNENTFYPENCWSLRQGKIYFYFNKEEKIPCKHQLKHHIDEYICVPLLAQSEILGVLYLEINQARDYSKNEVYRLEAENLKLIETISGHISLAISNINLRDKLNKRAIIDPLTSLYNRSYLDDTLERDIDRAIRKGTTIAVVMMDLDNFKHINDAYSHPAGDRVLREISDLLLKNIRNSDLVCRYGGEEILIGMYDIPREEAYNQIERIRKKIENLTVTYGADLIGPLSASFGMAMCPQDATTLEAIIAAADSALYESKKTGKNKITFYRKDQ